MIVSRCAAEKGGSRETMERHEKGAKSRMSAGRSANGDERGTRGGVGGYDCEGGTRSAQRLANKLSTALRHSLRNRRFHMTGWRMNMLRTRGTCQACAIWRPPFARFHDAHPGNVDLTARRATDSSRRSLFISRATTFIPRDRPFE